MYEECRRNCYENDIFFQCLNATLVPQETQQDVVETLASIDGGDIFGLEFITD